MLEKIIGLFKIGPYAEASKVLQAVHFMLDTFSHEKLVDGVNSRDAALDAVIALLQSEKSIPPTV